MSWMTSPVGASGSAGTADAAVPGTGSTLDICAFLLRPEDLGEVVAPSLHPDESDAEVSRAVLHRGEHPFAGELHGEGVCAAVEVNRCSTPLSITTRWSEIRSSSPSRCEVTTTEMEKSVLICWIRVSISSRPVGSSPLVGSSSSTSFGSCTSDWASFTRCFMPVEYPPIGRYRSSYRPTSVSY